MKIIPQPIWLYRGAELYPTPYADIPYDLRPGGRYSDLVQRALDEIEPWQNGDDPRLTLKLRNAKLLAMTVPVDQRIITWGIHLGHKAIHPQPSPFIRIPSAAVTDFITIEIKGPVEQPDITRVYPGEYSPPLPWMGSARGAIGGLTACRDFWRTNGYVYNPRLLKRGTETLDAPDWFTSM